MAYRFSTDGTVIGTRRVTPSATTALRVSKTAYWNAVRHALVADGPLAGYWVPVTAVNLG